MREKIADARLVERIAAARALMRDAKVKVLVIFAHPRAQGGGGVLHYLAGWTPGSSASVMVLSATGEARILSAGPNVTRVFNQRCGAFATATAYAGMAGLAMRLAEALAAAGIKAGEPVGTFGADDMPAALRRPFDAAAPQQATLDTPLNDLRLVRHADEVALHQRAADISVAMIARIMELGCLPETTPRQLMVEAERTGRMLGADQSGLWLATGERPPTTYFEQFELADSIGPRDRIQLGTTISYEGHFGQCLRTGVRGTPSAELIDCTAQLIAMQDSALAQLAPGRPLHLVVDTLESMIDAFCPYTRQKDPFRFQSCHGLGVNYAEPCIMTALTPDRDLGREGAMKVAAEHMIIEIHPNFTLPGLGHVCIGDMARVTANGAEWITRTPRELIRLD